MAQQFVKCAGKCIGNGAPLIQLKRVREKLAISRSLLRINFILVDESRPAVLWQLGDCAPITRMYWYSLQFDLFQLVDVKYHNNWPLNFRQTSKVRLFVTSSSGSLWFEHERFSVAVEFMALARTTTNKKTRQARIPQNQGRSGFQ